MRSVIAERLNDLENVARRLQEMIDAERPERLLPGMILCRVAVTADKAVSELTGFLDSLAAVRESADNDANQGRLFDAN